VNKITNLEPLCAMVLLRMSHAQLLRALFSDEDSAAAESIDGEKAAQQKDEDPEDFPTCEDDSITLDFALLEEGHLSRAGVYRLSSHISTCNTCKEVFAAMVCVERRAKALDNFEGCEDYCG
jgi:hypothetical protein